MLSKLSYPGLIVATIYTVAAAYLIWDNYRYHSGDFLRDLTPALLTAPVSIPIDWLNLLPDNLYLPWVAAPFVLATAAICYFLAARIARLFSRYK